MVILAIQFEHHTLVQVHLGIHDFIDERSTPTCIDQIDCAHGVAHAQ